jgi:hypothetical protein
MLKDQNGAKNKWCKLKLTGAQKYHQTILSGVPASPFFTVTRDKKDCPVLFCMLNTHNINLLRG